MNITKDKFVLIYRIVLIIVSFISLYLNFQFIPFRIGILYFTYLSNIAGLLYFIVLVIRTIFKKDKDNDNEWHYIVKGKVTMALTLTMFVYYLILAKGNTSYINHELECALVHLIVPLLVIFDYIFFGKKGHLRKEYPYIWSIALIIYQGFIIFYSSIGGRFLDGDIVPYLYMDSSKFGTIGVMINYILIFIIFIVYGQIVCLIDNYLGKRMK